MTEDPFTERVKKAVDVFLQGPAGGCYVPSISGDEEKRSFVCDHATKIGPAHDYDNIHAPGQLSRNETMEMQSILDKAKSEEDLTTKERERLAFLCQREPLGGCV